MLWWALFLEIYKMYKCNAHWFNSFRYSTWSKPHGIDQIGYLIRTLETKKGIYELQNSFENFYLRPMFSSRWNSDWMKIWAVLFEHIFWFFMNISRQNGLLADQSMFSTFINRSESFHIHIQFINDEIQYSRVSIFAVIHIAHYS